MLALHVGSRQLMHAAGLRLPRVAAGAGFFCNEPEPLVNINTTTLDTPPILSLHEVGILSHAGWQSAPRKIGPKAID